MRHSKDTRLDELQPAHGENKIPCKARRQLRRLLFMTTFGGAIITAPQIANAATHVLTGAQTTTQTVTTDTDSVVTVNTDNTFSVNATSGDALTISGAGSITYDDLGNNNTLSTTGAGGNGLSITSTGDNAGPPAENGSITVISGGTISGANDGIFATNAGTGGISITTTGNVSGGFAGIEVSNTNVLATGDVTVNTSGTVEGGTYGISVINDGLGTTSIDSSLGTVTGTSGDGINVLASNSANTNDVTVTTADVNGGTNGIVVENDGLGTTSVDSSLGTVTGTSGDGINVLASNILNTNDVTVTTADVSGGTNGIVVDNQGTGDTSVTSTGTVTGTANDGILAQNFNTSAGDLTVNANDVNGGSYGIYATNAGTGLTSVTSTGTVTGTTNDGIYATNTANATGDVTVNANNVTGGVYGIETYNAGSGITTITTDGVVQGGTAGIYAASSLTQPIDITVNNGSEVRNTSQNPADLAIQTVSDGATTLTNNGTVTGTVIFGAGNDTFTNNGTWNTSGTSDFDGGNDTLTNSSTGTINTSGTTTVLGVDTVNNFGTIDMQNGIAGETTTFTNGGTGDFIVNDGSTLLVDTNIATQQSDVLNVDNVQIGTGPTDVGVNVVAGLGQPINSDGILVVQDTSSDPNAFTMTPFNGGLYSYYLDEHANENYYLQSAVRPEAVATGVLPILGSRTALSTLSNLHDRQRDENALSNDDESRKGVWGRVFGQSNDFNANDANDFGFNSRVWGVQAGLDLMASGDNLGNRKYAGLYIAYASASGDARQFDNKVANLDLNATTIGAYYTKYSSDNWYLDLVAQYSSLGGIHAKTATDDISPGGKSYALSLEAGKQFHPDSSIVREVQAQLIDQYTDMDNVTLDDGTHVNVSGLNAVTGRFGLRLYGNPKGGKSFLPWFRANIWHTFSGDSTISSLGSSINTPIGGTSGELELGFTKGNSQSGGWGFYGSAGYLFDISGAEYSGWKGTLGLRKGW